MTVVFKLGGSLLTLPDLKTKLQTAIEHRSQQSCLIISGGGAAADIVREWSRVHRLNEESAHWLALASLDLNRRLLEDLFSGKSANSREQADAFFASSTAPLFLNTTAFLAAEEATLGSPSESGNRQIGGDRSGVSVSNVSTPMERLPHHWGVTSDSIAAWISIRWPADELVLLKSTPLPRDLNAGEASRANLVDSFFPQLADHVNQISWCNLRAPEIAIEPWLHRHRNQ